MALKSPKAVVDAPVPVREAPVLRNVVVHDRQETNEGGRDSEGGRGTRDEKSEVRVVGFVIGREGD